MLSCLRVLLIVNMLNTIKFSVILLNSILLIVTVLKVTLLNVILLNVTRINNVALKCTTEPEAVFFVVCNPSMNEL